MGISWPESNSLAACATMRTPCADTVQNVATYSSIPTATTRHIAITSDTRNSGSRQSSAITSPYGAGSSAANISTGMQRSSARDTRMPTLRMNHMPYMPIGRTNSYAMLPLDIISNSSLSFCQLNISDRNACCIHM